MHPIPRAASESLRPLTLVLAAFAAAPLAADTLTVCAAGCHSSTIQGALSMASDGDTIRVATTDPHTEPEIVVSRSVTIVGPGGGQSATVQAAAGPGTSMGRVLSVPLGKTVVLRDLILRYGSVEDGAIGGGIVNRGHLTLDGVSVQENDATYGGGLYNSGTLVLLGASVIWANNAGLYGGGIYNGDDETLVASDAHLVANTAFQLGGNLYNRGTATLIRSAIVDGVSQRGGGAYNTNDGSLTFSGRMAANQADWGGAIYQASGALEVSNAAMISNEASHLGGGAAVEGGSAVFTGTTFSSNSARDGGAIYHSSATSLHLRNTTLSDNSASDDGGAIYVAGSRSVTAASSTIANNEADADQDDDGAGGGLFLAPCSGSICLLARAYLRNTIVADNVDRSPAGGSQHHDCKGELTSQGYNLVEAAGTSAIAPCRVGGDLTGVVLATDPMLGPLANNGGTPTFGVALPPKTRALLSGSPAIDAGNPAGCTDANDEALPADQRGAARVGTCDLGSYEYGGVPTVGIFADGFETGSTALWSGG
jgi:predicted outer membrane repeat protein